ncbi:MAG: response regulator [Bdellovibrionales bacterium]|nr:response regulator [Massilia sp.]
MLPARLRVLLLDDDSFVLEIIADMLKELGSFDVRCESDARRALQVLAIEQPHLLICDLSMPDMDGIEFMHAAADAHFKGSVMLLSGMDEGVRRAAERLARAHGLKVLGTYKKPISAEELRGALACLTGPSGDADGDVHNVTTLSGK